MITVGNEHTISCLTFTVGNEHTVYLYIRSQLETSIQYSCSYIRSQLEMSIQYTCGFSYTTTILYVSDMKLLSWTCGQSCAGDNIPVTT